MRYRNLVDALSLCLPLPDVNRFVLTFQALEGIVQECARSGAIATDDYCKQAQAVYGPKWQHKKEADRLARLHSRGAASHADVSVPSF
jgi:hypothetical protein